MSVTVAYNVLKQFDLSPKESKELADLLQGKSKRPKKENKFEWAKRDFKARLMKISEKEKPSLQTGS